MKNFKQRKKIRGFTLVEVMTSLVIMTILITIASGVIITTFNIFARNTMFRVAQNEGNNVYNFLYDHISYSTSLKIGKYADITNEGISLTPDFNVTVLDEKFVGQVKEGSAADSPYFEGVVLNSNKKGITLYRKGMDKADGSQELVYIFGNQSGETPAAMECTVSFAYDSSKSDRVTCTVQIERDSEVFYSKTGEIPLYNYEYGLKDRMSVSSCNSSDSNTYIIYTYLQ